MSMSSVKTVSLLLSILLAIMVSSCEGKVELTSVPSITQSGDAESSGISSIESKDAQPESQAGSDDSKLVSAGGSMAGATPTVIPKSKTVSIKGAVQKGPFINGTSISIYELDEKLIQTGKVYETQIEDNAGNYSIRGVTLSSNYVMIKADGFYFNEAYAKKSSSPLTLYAFADITDSTTINVNLLTHIEKSRVEVLVDSGKTFKQAKLQARNELLKVFSIANPDIASLETLSITAKGESNAILLAISLIIQGYRDTSEISELVANISQDFKADGVLNNPEVKSALINDAKLIASAYKDFPIIDTWSGNPPEKQINPFYTDFPQIRKNLVERYSSMGIIATIPDFESQITDFVNNTNYVMTKLPIYPEKQDGKINILNENVTKLELSTSYLPQFTMGAILPEGATLKIRIDPPNVEEYETISLWTVNSVSNWITAIQKVYSPYERDVSYFVPLDVTKECSADLYLGNSGASGILRIEFYENNSKTPTKVKNLEIICDSSLVTPPAVDG